MLSPPVQNRMDTTVSGQLQSSPHMVVVRYHRKKGSQHTKKAPITIPRVTKALCSLPQLVELLVSEPADMADRLGYENKLGLSWLSSSCHQLLPARMARDHHSFMSFKYFLDGKGHHTTLNKKLSLYNLPWLS